MQLLFAFIILSTITIIAILLVILNKNTRSGKVRDIAQKNNWQYQEFIDLDNTLKSANFGLLNHSQNAIFRHIISSDGAYNTNENKKFRFFDCRAIEPSGIHNSSVILSYLDLSNEYQKLHACFTPITANQTPSKNPMQSPIDKLYLARLRHLQKLSLLSPHYAFQRYQLHANTPRLLENFLQQHLSKTNTENTISKWLLAHPHLHIEISNGILLAYQPNCLLDEDSITSAIKAVCDISERLNNA